MLQRRERSLAPTRNQNTDVQPIACHYADSCHDYINHKYQWANIYQKMEIIAAAYGADWLKPKHLCFILGR
jgi:hypothetical protein